VLHYLKSDERPGLTCIKKSPEGLWVKSELGDNSIDVYYHSRHQYRDGSFLHINSNGEVESECDPWHLEFDEPWVKVGEIGVNSKEFLGLCDVNEFDWLVYGVMRHVVGLIVLGWGDSIEDTVGLFENVALGEFVVPGCPYVIVGPFWAPFHSELEGCYVNNAKYVDRKFSCEFDILERNMHKIEVDGGNILSSFLISTVPC